MIALCVNCKAHPFQDARYGKNRRVMNSCKEGKSLRCTVCGAERNYGGTDGAKK